MKPHMVLFLYAVLIIGAGLVAFMTAPEDANKATALIAPVAGAVVTVALAAASFFSKSPKLSRGLLYGAIGFVGFFGLSVAGRAATAGGDPEKAYLLPILWTIVGLSVLAVVGTIVVAKKHQALTAKTSEGGA
ncbi:MAG: hypothetical protein EA423_05985 [Phycisphaerales bacterium]|nr:MAG: hypothetical protein EA423_05985 [Phycisphaerales bacterium]